MDFADNAAELSELDNQIAINNRQPPTPFTGFCLNCDEHIDRGQFCGFDCRHDYERRIRAERQSGRM